MARLRPAVDAPETPTRRRAATAAPANGKAPRKDRRKVAAVAARPAYERRYRQTIRRVDLWSVLKISICFYLTALIVFLFACVVLWWIASATGIIGDLESFVADAIGNEEDDFEFLSWEVLRATTLVGLVFVCLTVVVTTLAAAFYNLFSEVIGGIEVTVVEDEHTSGR